MKRYQIMVLGIMAGVCAMAQNIDRPAVEHAVRVQMLTHPRQTLRDIYKSFFQDNFGPGHLINDSESALSYIEGEAQMVDSVTRCEPMYEPVGWKGRFVRVNLSAVSDSIVPAETLVAALVESANLPVEISVEEWANEWQEIEDVVRSMYPDLPNFEADSQAIREILNQGKYVSHHSKTYNEAYHTHYRLIATDIFYQRLHPLIEK